MVKIKGLIQRKMVGNHGSFTVEAALIFPIIIMALACLVIALMLMYHKILLTKTVTEVAAQAAVRQLEKDRMYSRIFEQNLLPQEETYRAVVGKDDSLGSKCRKLLKQLESEEPGYYEREFIEIQLAVYQELSRKIMKPQETTVTVNFQQELLTRGITITITQDMELFFGSIKRFFDGKETISITGTAKASVTEPPEYIRNIDLALEYAQRIKKGLSEKLPDFRSTTAPSMAPGGN